MRSRAAASVTGLPSIATMRSPWRRTRAAGACEFTLSTAVLCFSVCTDGFRFASVIEPSMLPLTSTTQYRRNAIRRFTPGPARMTAIRFHGGWA